MNPETPEAIWNELLAGYWVVVDRTEDGHRRTLTLRRAMESERAALAFTPLEREVVALAVRAQPLKVMAAELGRSTSRVAEVLCRVRTKLGAPTHADLLRMVGSFGPCAHFGDATLSADGTMTSAAAKPASTPIAATSPRSRRPPNRQTVSATKPAAVVSAVEATSGA